MQPAAKVKLSQDTQRLNRNQPKQIRVPLAPLLRVLLTALLRSFREGSLQVDKDSTAKKHIINK